jgi:hypothetical protein
MAKKYSKRRYSVFARVRGGWTWHRLSGLALPKESAVRVFQSMLLAGSIQHGLEMALKPVSEECFGVEYPMLGAIREEGK